MLKKPNEIKLLERELFEDIVREFVNGTSLRTILKRRQVHLWDFYHAVESNPDWIIQYNKAQEYKAEVFADDNTEIADTEENPAKARNRIDARKWYAAKIKPQKYGERIDINVNKTIDIRSAIAEGRNRIIAGHSESAALLTRDLETQPKLETIDITGINLSESTGQQPVERLISNTIESKLDTEINAEEENHDDDIFS